jgi:hypothetical protein
VAVIMDSVPATPDQTVKDATTARILDHVRRGWPHLDEVVITFRGQFCYVALPGLSPGLRIPVFIACPAFRSERVGVGVR